MKKLFVIFFLFICCTYLSASDVFANEYSKAESYIRKSQAATIKDESYEYINQAREIYQNLYNENQSDTKALLGLSKTFQLTGDRREAKLYVLKAYNIAPYEAELQKAMADFHYSFQEYSTALEYYKLALSSGLLKDFETNLATAKCYEKLGDLKNAELYYQICAHLNSKSRKVLNKLNEYESAKHPDNTKELEEAKYKYLYKDKRLPENEQTDIDAEKIIEQLSG